MPAIYLQQYQAYASHFVVDLDESIDAYGITASVAQAFPSFTADIDESVDVANSTANAVQTFPTFTVDIDESIDAASGTVSVDQTFPSFTVDVDESVDVSSGSASVTQTFPSLTADLDESVDAASGSTSVSRTYPSATADLDESIDVAPVNGTISGDVEAEVDDSGTVYSWGTLVNGTAHQIRLYEAGVGGAEISGGGYSRGSTSFSGSVDVIAYNDLEVTFSPTADWGPVIIKAYTTGGTLLAEWDSFEYDIGPNRTFTIPTNTIKIL